MSELHPSDSYKGSGEGSPAPPTNTNKPLAISNRGYTFNFVSYQDNDGSQVMFSVTSNENVKGGQFSSISLTASEVHKLAWSLQSLLDSIQSKAREKVEHKIATRQTSSLVLAFDGTSLSIFLNKRGNETGRVKLDRFAANLIRIKATEHLCKCFDLTPEVVCKMLADVGN